MSPVVKDVGVVSAPVVKDVGVVTPPAAKNVGVAADSPRTARSSSHATIVSYKDMIRDSPQFRAKKEHVRLVCLCDVQGVLLRVFGINGMGLEGLTE